MLYFYSKEIEDLLVLCSLLMKKNILEILKKNAMSSNVHQRHSAIIFKGSKILSIGVNKYVCDKFTVHAEIDALMLANFNKNISSVSDFDIIVIRLNIKGDSFIYSKPCGCCIEKLKRGGVNNIYYSDSNGEIVCENIKDITKSHISSAQRRNLNFK